jgi:hypothetical protein
VLTAKLALLSTCDQYLRLSICATVRKRQTGRLPALFENLVEALGEAKRRSVYQTPLSSAELGGLISAKTLSSRELWRWPRSRGRNKGPV